MKYCGCKTILSFLLFFAVGLTAYPQSRYLESGISGAALEVNTVLDESNNIVSAGLGAAYSIGGIMDIGFELNRGTGTILDYDRTDWVFNLQYNVIVIKQTRTVPISCQLEGSYGFTNVSSEYLDNFNYLRQGQGFELGAALFHEFNSRGSFSLLLGGKGSYRNYRTTEINNQNPDVPVINSIEKSEQLKWGGIAALSLKPNRWPYFSVEVEFLYEQNSGTLFIEPSIIFTSHSY